MKRKKEILVLVLIIGALSLYLVFQKSDKTHYALPELPEIGKGDITRVVIKKGEEEKTLQLENSRWTLHPQGYPADKDVVEKMLEILRGLTLTALASEAGNDSIFDLDEPERIEVAAYAGNDLRRKVHIGKAAPSFRHTFVKLEGDKRIFHAEENFRSRFDKEGSQLRDKQVMKIDEEIAEVRLASGAKSLSVFRATAPVSVDPEAEQQEAAELAAETPAWQTGDGKPVKEKEIDALVKTLSDLKCDAYVEERKIEDLGDPSFTVSLKGTQEYGLSLYDEQDKKTVCTSTENDYVFLVPEWKAKKIKLDLDSLLEP